MPTEKAASLGVNPNYSYSVISFSNKGIELRNSWGTIEERSKLSFRSEGNFDLSSSQIRENISHIVVTNIQTEYSTTTIQARHRLGFYSSHSFKVRNSIHGFLTVSQWDERLFPTSAGYEYSPASVILQKTNGDGSVEFINASKLFFIQTIPLTEEILTLKSILRLAITQLLLLSTGKELTTALISPSMDLKELISQEFIPTKNLTSSPKDLKASMLTTERRLTLRDRLSTPATKEKAICLS